MVCSTMHCGLWCSWTVDCHGCGLCCWGCAVDLLLGLELFKKLFTRWARGKKVCAGGGGGGGLGL